VAELVPTGNSTHSPSRGDAEHLTVRVAGAEARDAALRYPESPIEDFRDHVRFEWDAMDAWFEEDEEVFTHVRSPYARIDILPTSRHVRVMLGDTVLAESTGAHALFETGLPPRWYVPRVDVRMDLLVRSDTVTHWPYKGQAEHLTARIGDDEVKDVGDPHRAARQDRGMPDALDRQIQETVANGRGYTLVLLWEGPRRDQAEAEADRLQQEHLRHLFTLRNEGKLLLNGPVLDDSELVGIAIYAGQDRDAVRALAEADPSVKAGRLRVDVRPLFGIPGDAI
jgi:uncharacterized protein (DUF427 family)/uncharacterized protein YciI